MDEAVEQYAARRAEALALVRRLVIERLRVDRAPDELDPDTALFGSGLGLDSIDAVELIVALETAYGVSIGDDVFGRAGMRTINGIVDLLLGGSPSGGSSVVA